MDNIRIYNKKNHDGSLHALGNGQLCVMEQGPNIFEIFGKPYSSTMLGSLTMDMDARIERVTQACIYRHFLENGAVFEDFVDAELSCFVRKINTAVPFVMKLSIESDFELIRNDDIKAYRVLPGQFVCFPHVTTCCQVYGLSGCGNIIITKDEVIAGIGESYLYIAGCQAYNELVEIVEEVKSTSYNKLYSRTEKY